MDELIQHPRDGWEEQFRLMAESSDDDELNDWDVPGLNSWDEEEWEWEGTLTSEAPEFPSGSLEAP